MLIHESKATEMCLKVKADQLTEIAQQQDKNIHHQ